MKIGLRGGHSPNCKGAIGLIDEQVEVRKIYNVYGRGKRMCLLVCMMVRW